MIYHYENLKQSYCKLLTSLSLDEISLTTNFDFPAQLLNPEDRE